MKGHTLSILLFLSLSFASSNGHAEDIDLRAEFTDLNIQNKIMDSEGVKNNCKIEPSTPNKDQAIKDCVTKFKAMLQSKLTTPQAVDDFMKNLGINSNELNNVGVSQTEGNKKLTEHLANKLEEGLYGKDYAKKKLKELNYVDQETYVKLYKSQVGKAIVLDISRYCMENLEGSGGGERSNAYNASASSNPSNGGTPTNVTGTQAAFNDVNAKQTNFGILQNPGSSGQSPKQFFETECIGNIAKNCDKYKATCAQNIGDASCTGSGGGSGKFACALLDRMKGYKSTLAQTDQIVKMMEKFKNNPGYDVSAAYAGVYNGTGDNSIDNLTTVTSKDIVDGVGNTNKEALAEFEKKCASSQDLQGCERFINKDQETDLAKITAEHQLRSELMLHKMALLKDNQEAWKKFLEEQGKTKEEVEKLFADNANDLNKIKDEVKKSFIAERNSVIAQLNAELEGKMVKTPTTQGNGGGNANTPNPNDVKLVKDKIKAELEDRTNRMARLVHFSNIVSSYLSLADSKGNSLGNYKKVRTAEAGSSFIGDAAYFSNFDQFDTPTRGPSSSTSDTGETGGFLSLADCVISTNNCSNSGNSNNSNNSTNGNP